MKNIWKLIEVIGKLYVSIIGNMEYHWKIWKNMEYHWYFMEYHGI